MGADPPPLSHARQAVDSTSGCRKSAADLSSYRFPGGEAARPKKVRLATLKRAMHPAEKPPDAERDDCGRIRLCLDRPPQPLVERTGGVPGRIRGLTEQILTHADCL